MTDLKVEPEIICARLGFTQVPDVLEGLATPVLRGHHIGLLAGEGSGKEALIALAAIEDSDLTVGGIQVLVLVADVGRGRRLAAAVHRAAEPEGISVSFASSGAGESRNPGETTVLVGRPSDILPAVRVGHASLASLRLLVIDGVADMRNLGEWDSVDPILETLPKGSRKIAISDRPDPEFTALLERQLSRARRWPEELLPVVVDGDAVEVRRDPARTVLCGLESRAGFADALQRCVAHAEAAGCSQLEILCPSELQAAHVAADVAIAGWDGQQDGMRVRVNLPGQGDNAVLQVGLPWRLDAFAPAFEGEGPRYAIVEPSLGPQLNIMLQRAGRRMGIFPGASLARDVEIIQRYRLWLQEQATQGDLLSELLVLEPLFEELGAVRLAAALSRILRGRSDLPRTVRPWAEVEEALTGDHSTGGRMQRQTRGTRQAWTRLYFGVGRRDEAKPGDLVGAITGEAGIAGAQIGKIEIMGNFSLVDVDSQVADEVIDRLAGVTIRGRSVPVRADRNT